MKLCIVFKLWDKKVYIYEKSNEEHFAKLLKYSYDFLVLWFNHLYRQKKKKEEEMVWGNSYMGWSCRISGSILNGPKMIMG